MASIFGADVLGMKTNELILFFLMIQGIAFVGAMIFGFLADAIGSKRTVIISLGIWSLIVLWAFQLGIIWDPKTEYWILGVLVAIVLGGQSGSLPISSRDLYARCKQCRVFCLLRRFWKICFDLRSPDLWNPDCHHRKRSIWGSFCSNLFCCRNGNPLDRQ